MSPNDFRTGVINPIECLKEGWELIKDQYWLIFAITLVGILIASFVPFGILLGPMFCGIYYAIFQKMNGLPAKFEDLFKGFNYFGSSFVASLFLIVPAFIGMIIIYIPLIAMQFSMAQQRGNPDPNAMFAFFGFFMIAIIILYLILGIFHALLMFAYPLIVERNLSGVEAFKLSARAVMKNLGGVVLFILCEFVLAIAGYLIFCVGVYLTIPIMFAGALVMYRKVFPALNSPNANNPPPPNAFRGAGNYN